MHSIPVTSSIKFNRFSILELSSSFPSDCNVSLLFRTHPIRDPKSTVIPTWQRAWHALSDRQRVNCQDHHAALRYAALTCGPPKEARPQLGPQAAVPSPRSAGAGVKTWRQLGPRWSAAAETAQLGCSDRASQTAETDPPAESPGPPLF